jgi:ribosomal protein L11 methyltransferase
MPLHKLRIEAADLQAAQRAADRLADPAAPEALAITLFELAPPAFVVEAYYDRAPSLEAIAGLLTGQRAELGPPSLEEVADANWVALSQAALPPVRAGRFVVHGSHDRARFAMRRLAIEIEAGEAFGTAHNATTVLCLQALDRLTRKRRFGRVLDLGCGTGVLGIAAARMLPAARVVASDNDPVAIAIARENGRLNRVSQRITFVTAAGLANSTLRRARFDLVLANLLPGPLIALAPAMRQAIGTGGVAVLSGLLSHQAREVAAVYGATGFHLVGQRHDAGWSMLMLRRSACEGNRNAALDAKRAARLVLDGWASRP